MPLDPRLVWMALAATAMGAVAVGLVLVFWRKRYLEQTSERSGDNQAP